MTSNKDTISSAIMYLLNGFSSKLEISKAMRLKDFKGSEAAVERLEDGLYRIYIRDSDQPDSEIYMFDIEIDSPIEGSALYKKMNLSIDVKDKIAYSKKRLKIAEAVHRLLKKSILFPEYDEEI